MNVVARHLCNFKNPSWEMRPHLLPFRPSGVTKLAVLWNERILCQADDIGIPLMPGCDAPKPLRMRTGPHCESRASWCAEKLLVRQLLPGERSSSRKPTQLLSAEDLPRLRGCHA